MASHTIAANLTSVSTLTGKLTVRFPNTTAGVVIHQNEAVLKIGRFLNNKPVFGPILPLANNDND